jgi:hypothetical protein
MCGREFKMMYKITMPFSYSICLQKAGRKGPQYKNCAAVDVAEFNIPEYSSDDVVPVARWRQRWKHDKPIPPQSSTGVLDTWQDQFLADEALAQIILIDGKLYGPVKAVDDAVSLLTVDNFRQTVEMAGDRRFLTVGARCVDQYDTASFRETMVQSGYLENGKQPSKETYEGWKKRYDDRDARFEVTKQNLVELAVVDGILFAPVEQPVLIVEFDTEGRGGVWIGQPSPYINPRRQFIFDLTDHEGARCFVEGNFDPDKSRICVQDVVIEVPEVLSRTPELRYPIQATTAFFEDIESFLPELERTTGAHWYKAKAILKAGDNLTADQMDQVVSHMEYIAQRLPEEFPSAAEAKRISNTAKLAADRWTLRPLTQSAGMEL